MTALGVFIRGLLMGAADIVPGVSGGTVAFITGIYRTLLDSIRSIDTHFVALVFRGDIAAAWRHINGSFLLPLLCGIAVSVLSLARGIAWLLVHHPIPLWAFFFGLILASAVLLLGQVERWSFYRALLLLVAVVVAVSISVAPAQTADLGVLSIFFAGFFAICAMILPGISGSFILLLLGMYGPVLLAIKSFDLAFIAVFALGAASGLLCFSRLLAWLLERFYSATMSVLTGFLFGSLAIVWPWKRVLQWVAGSDGEPKAAQQLPVMPEAYQIYSGQDPQLLLCLLLAISGFIFVVLLEKKWRHPGSSSVS